jgi:hypothetical protein
MAFKSSSSGGGGGGGGGNVPLIRHPVIAGCLPFEKTLRKKWRLSSRSKSEG